MKALLLLFLTTLTLFASIGKVVAFRGDAHIDRASEKVSIKLGTDIEKSDIIYTKSNAKMQIIFKDKTIITIGPNSKFGIEEYANKSKKPKASFSMFKGTFKTITGKIGKISPERFKIKTKSATIGIRGTQFIVNANKGNMNVMCTQGKIVVTDNVLKQTVSVPAGFSTVVRSGEAPKAPQRITATTLKKAKEKLEPKKEKKKKETTDSNAQKSDSTDKDSEGKKSEESDESETSDEESSDESETSDEESSDETTEDSQSDDDKDDSSSETESEDSEGTSSSDEKENEKSGSADSNSEGSEQSNSESEGSSETTPTDETNSEGTGSSNSNSDSQANNETPPSDTTPNADSNTPATSTPDEIGASLDTLADTTPPVAPELEGTPDVVVNEVNVEAAISTTVNSATQDAQANQINDTIVETTETIIEDNSPKVIPTEAQLPSETTVIETHENEFKSLEGENAHLSWGYWVDSETEQKTAMYLDGIATAQSVVQTHISNNFKASYNGDVIGFENGSTPVNGTFSMDVDFGEKHIGVSEFNVEGNNVNWNAASTLTNNVNMNDAGQFNAKVNGIENSTITGSLQGQFYGNDAQAVGGQANLNDGSNTLDATFSGLR